MSVHPYPAPGLLVQAPADPWPSVAYPASFAPATPLLHACDDLSDELDRLRARLRPGRRARLAAALAPLDGRLITPELLEQVRAVVERFAPMVAAERPPSEGQRNRRSLRRERKAWMLKARHERPKSITRPFTRSASFREALYERDCRT